MPWGSRFDIDLHEFCVSDRGSGAFERPPYARISSECTMRGSIADHGGMVRRFCLKNTGKGIVVMITDLMSKTGYETALKMLVAREMDIYLIHILSPEELKPTLTGDLKLLDCEDQDMREVSVSATLLERYEQTLNGFIEQARSFCNRRSITYVSVRSDHEIDPLLNEYLRARGLVR